MITTPASKGRDEFICSRTLSVPPRETWFPDVPASTVCSHEIRLAGPWVARTGWMRETELSER